MSLCVFRVRQTGTGTGTNRSIDITLRAFGINIHLRNVFDCYYYNFGGGCNWNEHKYAMPNQAHNDCMSAPWLLSLQQREFRCIISLQNRYRYAQRPRIYEVSCAVGTNPKSKNSRSRTVCSCRSGEETAKRRKEPNNSQIKIDDDERCAQRDTFISCSVEHRTRTLALLCVFNALRIIWIVIEGRQWA